MRASVTTCASYVADSSQQELYGLYTVWLEDAAPGMGTDEQSAQLRRLSARPCLDLQGASCCAADRQISA